MFYAALCISFFEGVRSWMNFSSLAVKLRLRTSVVVTLSCAMGDFPYSDSNC